MSDEAMLVDTIPPVWNRFELVQCNSSLFFSKSREIGVHPALFSYRDDKATAGAFNSPRKRKDVVRDVYTSQSCFFFNGHFSRDSNNIGTLHDETDSKLYIYIYYQLTVLLYYSYSLHSLLKGERVTIQNVNELDILLASFEKFEDETLDEILIRVKKVKKCRYF